MAGHTLVIPGCGSLAHLGELCVDALVTSFGLSRAAIVHSNHLLPMASASAWEAPGTQGSAFALTTAAEIYQGAAAPKLSVLQLRSAVVEGRRNALAGELWAWACEQGVAEVIIVSSCSSHVKVDADFDSGTDLRYVLLGGEGKAPEAVPGLPGLLPLDHALPEEDMRPGESREIAAVLRFLRGGGLARPLLLRAAEAAEEAADVKKAEDKDGAQFTPPPRGGGAVPGVLCLLGLSSESLGLMLTEQLAVTTCAALAKRLKLDPAPRLKAPPSWMFEMEAAPLDRRLWG